MDKRIIACTLAGVLLGAAGCTDKPVTGCSSGWYLTGYFTPVEGDYPPTPSVVIRTSNGQQLTLPKGFTDNVRVEGWGKTNAGFYVGKYHGQWHINHQPLDALGGLLEIGSIATDKRLIPHGKTVTIPSLKNLSFTANDIGPAIVGKHIDIFCGEGKAAEQRTFQVTQKNAEVCVHD